MASADGELRTVVYEGAVPELRAGVEAGRPVDARWLEEPATKIINVSMFLAVLNVAARARPDAEHDTRAEALNRQIASTRAPRRAMPVAALLSGAPRPGARMALLDHIIILLGPGGGDTSVRNALARDSAMVLLLLDTDAAPRRGPELHRSAAGTDPADDFHSGAADVIAEIAEEAERAIADAVAGRQARYHRAVDAGSLADAVAVVRDAAADDDHEQAWSLLDDIARRHPGADPDDLVTVGVDVLGTVPLDSDGIFDGPGGSRSSPAPSSMTEYRLLSPAGSRLSLPG